jgi:hypothetical protein
MCRVTALADLDARQDQEDLVGVRDSDEGIGREPGNTPAGIERLLRRRQHPGARTGGQYLTAAQREAKHEPAAPLQDLPDMAMSISESVGFGRCRNSAVADMIWPDWQ